MRRLRHVLEALALVCGVGILSGPSSAAAQSCGEIGGDYCSQSGSCPTGYDSLGSSSDCSPCCVREQEPPPGPSCGQMGGDYCSQTGSCPAGYDSLGSSSDCSP
ncbi:MAG: hypothetical protein ACRD1X_12835, partial [Vicinamibacteria bacterium]